MTLVRTTRDRAGLRRVGAVPWYRDGFRGLSVRALDEVPRQDDPVIRGALVRGVLSCRQIDRLEGAVNRELAPLGYVARLEWNAADRDVVFVEVSTGG